MNGVSLRFLNKKYSEEWSKKDGEIRYHVHRHVYL
jgi:hypothetical protein